MLPQKDRNKNNANDENHCTPMNNYCSLKRAGYLAMALTFN
jgi:hypothetical protein